MAGELSGTLYRIRYDDGGGMKTIESATSGSDETTTRTRTIVHKDNPGDWDEVIPDGFSGSFSCNFFMKDSSDYLQLRQAQLNKTLLTIDVSDNVSTNDLFTQGAYVVGMSATFTVRETVQCTVNLVKTGDVTISTVPV